MPLDRLAGTAHRAGSHVRRLCQRTTLGQILIALFDEVRADHVGIIAAGAAYYVFLAILPALTALVLFYGLIFDANDVVAHVDLLAGYAPEAVTQLLGRELERLAEASESSLSAGVVGSALVALWSATKGARSLIEGLNIIERAEESRGAIALYALSLAITACGVVLVGLVVTLVIALPALASYLPPRLDGVFTLVRHVVLPAVLLVSIMALYRFGSCAAQHRKWWSTGAIAAATLWMAVSWLLDAYVENVASVSVRFGSASTVVVFMLWLWLSCFVVLVGAELNVVLDLRARTTTPSSE